MSTPEGRVKADIKKWFEQFGDHVWYYMPVSNGMGRVGVPDFTCVLWGSPVYIETKAPGKRSTLTANQQREITAIRKAGGHAFVVESLAELIESLHQAGVLKKPKAPREKPKKLDDITPL